MGMQVKLLNRLRNALRIYNSLQNATTYTYFSERTLSTDIFSAFLCQNSINKRNAYTCRRVGIHHHEKKLYHSVFFTTFDRWKQTLFQLEVNRTKKTCLHSYMNGFILGRSCHLNYRE